MTVIERGNYVSIIRLVVNLLIENERLVPS